MAKVNWAPAPSGSSLQAVSLQTLSSLCYLASAREAIIIPMNCHALAPPSVSLCSKPEGRRGRPAGLMNAASVNLSLASVATSAWNELANTLRAANLFLFPSTTHRIDLAGWATTNPTEKSISKFKASVEVLIHRKPSRRPLALTLLLLRLILGFIDLP